MSEPPQQIGNETASTGRSEPDRDQVPSSAIWTALGVLLPLGGRVRGAASSGAVHWLIPGGLAIGLIYVGLYRASWRVFGEVAGVRLMPAVIVWLADVGLFGLLMIAGFARTAERWPTPQPRSGDWSDRGFTLAGALALSVLVLLKLALWVAIPEGIAGWPTNWRRYFNFMYPWPVFRPLILAPLWGRWGLLLAGGVGRAAPLEPPPAGLPGGTSLSAVLGWLVVVTGLTAIYSGRHGRWMIGCIISLGVLGVTFLFAVLSTRRFGGRTGFSVYGAALVAEVAFLLGYLAASQHIYRY